MSGSGREALIDAVRWYHRQVDQLIADHTDAGQHPDRPDTARGYWHDRGYTDETIERALLGWAPPATDGSAILDHLVERGHTREAIVASGLFSERRDGSLYPLWSGRYVFAYLDTDGRPAFAISRSTDADGQGVHPDDRKGHKYDKLPVSWESVTVKEPIYGLDSVRDGEPVLITEGIADAIAAHQAGYPCIAPVTTTFKHADRERLLDVIDARDVPRAYVIQDAEPPTSDLDQKGRLTLTQFGEGERGGVTTAAYLAEHGDVEARVGELPLPARSKDFDKVDLDDYLLGWAGEDGLDPILASAKPASEHPAYESIPRHRWDDGSGETSSTPTAEAGRMGSKRAPSPNRREYNGESDSALFDLSITDVAGVSDDYRGTNPLGHHGDSEEYFVVIDGGSEAYDHKYKATYTALTYLLCEAHDRPASDPAGELSDAEIYAAWKHAKRQGYLPTDDPAPFRAVRGAAEDHSLVDADGFVHRDSETGDFVAGPDDKDALAAHNGETYRGFPPGTYGDALGVIAEDGFDHGRSDQPNDEDTDDDRRHGSVEAVPSIPFGILALELDEARRYASKRGLDWPTTDEVRERIDDSVRGALEAEGYTVLDAPTSAGKTHTVASTEWANLLEAPEEVTGDRPVVLFCSTCDARDEAVAMAEDADIDVKVLFGYKEACSVGGGSHDPDPDSESDIEGLWIKGSTASEWFEHRIEHRGIAASAVHAKAESLAEFGYVATNRQASLAGEGDVRELPCCEEPYDCTLRTQWPEDGFTTDDGPRYDLVVATDPFAFVPSLRAETNVINDEQPDFENDLGDDQERVRQIVTACLGAIDGPDEVSTYEDLLSVGRQSNDGHRELGKPSSQVRKELTHGLDRGLEREWYFGAENAHTLAPALARALWYAASTDPDENGRRNATVPHHPPRLDADARDADGWNRTWVTVVIDEENEVQTIREAPDFSTARSVVGLDAWPNSWLWQRNVHPDMTVERVLDTDERALWRRIERGLTVIGVGDATRPAGNDGKWFTEEHAEAIIQQLRAEFGDQFSKAGCASAIEGRVRQLLVDVGVPESDIGTMHFGEEKSRNDFADEAVGLVYGCIDPGDDYVLDLLAECGLDARPTMTECPTCEGGGCAGDRGCHDGQRRETGREFDGPDADHASELLGSVRENHVAQMTGRFGRDLPDGQNALAFVATDACPPGLVDVTVPGVTWLARPSQKQRELVEHVRDHPGTTASEAAKSVGCSRQHAHGVFRALLEQNKATVSRGSGDFGADEYRWLQDGGPAHAAVDLDPGRIVNSGVWNSHTWRFTIPRSACPDAAMSVEKTDGVWGSLSPQLANEGDSTLHPD
jgi:hypothetical protein